ncbi:MAG: ORF6N domain-containing protein [Candidatus Omnitrophica bacterium]|nr:ORF6N domain-containing protein [Candidatus Omnitrophota bacterium]
MPHLAFASEGIFVTSKSKRVRFVKLTKSISIEDRILLIRGHRVLLSADLAEMYRVDTKALNQAVKRNRERFASDFMFRLTRQEKDEVVTNCDHLRKLRFTPYLPYAFTEYGAIMLANVLNSPRAVKVSLFVVRAFVKLREKLSIHRDLAAKLNELEKRVEKHDHNIVSLFQAIRQLMKEPERPKRRIGFHPQITAVDQSRPKQFSRKKCGTATL